MELTEVELKTGRKVKLRPLNFLERLIMKDVAIRFAKEDLYPIMYGWGKCLTLLGFRPDDLLEWKDEEIAEAGEWIITRSELDETQKKS